ncbi:universal stress protein [Sphaerisporangium sp. NPDC005288]|uniref:universal stress protein n=1 Tax=Sphaerisporangium sp. NPDC005288 TaxID=3155114 RepID=UPI0033AB4EEF
MAGQIVVGVDGSHSAAAAVEWAADDAVRRGARLRVVHVREPWSMDYPYRSAPWLPDALTAYWRAVLAATVDWVRGYAPGLQVSATLLTGAAAERLCTEAEDADELILGGGGPGGFVGAVLGSVGRDVAWHAMAPVVVVNRSPGRRHGEIVVGYDGSPVSEAAMEYALGEAARRCARVCVLYAWSAPPFSPYATACAGGLAEAMGEVTREVRLRLAMWRERCPGVTARLRPMRGHPVTALSDASRRADLVVVGSGAHGDATGAGFGGSAGYSVGYEVLRHARCPVAVVHPRETAGSRPGGGVINR